MLWSPPHLTLLPCFSRAVPALLSGALSCILHCRAGRLLPRSCKPFLQAGSKISPLEGPCKLSGLKQAHLLAALPSFITMRPKAKHFPSMPAPSRPCPAAPQSCSRRHVSGKYLSVVLKAGLCSLGQGTG